MKSFLQTIVVMLLPFAGLAQSLPQTEREQLSAEYSFGIGLLSVINGFVPVSFEQSLGGQLSLQISAGPTFRNQFNETLQSYMKDGARSEKFPEYTYTPAAPVNMFDRYDMDSNRSRRIGFMLGGAARCYFSDATLNGYFLGLLTQYRRYNSRISVLNESIAAKYNSDGLMKFTVVPDEYVSEHGNFVDLAIAFGHNRLSTKKVALEASFQMGVSFQGYHMQDLGTRFGPMGEQFAVNGERDYSAVRPYINFDLRFGLWR